MTFAEMLQFTVWFIIGASITFTGIYFGEGLLVFMGASVVGISIMATKTTTPDTEYKGENKKMLKYEDLSETEKQLVDAIKTGEWSYIMTRNIEDMAFELSEQHGFIIDDSEVSEEDKNLSVVVLCKQNGSLGIMAQYHMTPDYAKLIEETAKANA